MRRCISKRVHSQICLHVRRKNHGTYYAARSGHVDVAKVFLQNGADVNVSINTNRQYLATYSRCEVRCVLQVLCFGGEIDEETVEDDETELLRPIKDRYESLRAGNGIENNTMSDEERRFMWNLAFRSPSSIVELHSAHTTQLSNSSMSRNFSWPVDTISVRTVAEQRSWIWREDFQW